MIDYELSSFTNFRLARSFSRTICFVAVAFKRILIMKST